MTKENSRQSDKKVTKQVRIDSFWHRWIKTQSSLSGESIREILERALRLLVDKEKWEIYE